MSTAGKVLSVLVALMAVAWVLLTAAVAQLNRNGTQAVAALQKQVDQLQVATAKVTRDLQALKDDTHNEQVKTQNDLTVLQVRQSDAEKMLSGVKEISARVKLQLADADNAVKAGQVLSEERLAEREAETKAKSDAEALVEKLKAENQSLLANLSTLRDNFTAKLRENKQMVERLQKKAADAKTTTRAASFAR